MARPNAKRSIPSLLTFRCAEMGEGWKKQEAAGRASAKKIAGRNIRFMRAEQVRAEWTEDQHLEEEARLAAEVQAILAARAAAGQEVVQ